MSTPAQVRTAWQTYVWSKPMATQYTDKIFQYDVIAVNQREFAGLIYNQEINFFTAINIRAENSDFDSVGKIQYEHVVEVNYYLEVSKVRERGTNFNNVIDRLAALEAAIRADANFGKKWNNTVDYWQVTETNGPELTDIGGREVWRGSHIFTGSELVNC